MSALWALAAKPVRANSANARLNEASLGLARQRHAPTCPCPFKTKRKRLGVRTRRNAFVLRLNAILLFQQTLFFDGSSAVVDKSSGVKPLRAQVLVFIPNKTYAFF